MLRIFKRMTLRTKLIFIFTLLVIILGIINIFIGIKFIGDGIISQTQTHVEANLNSAHEIYQGSEEMILIIAEFTADRFFLKDFLNPRSQETVITELRKVVREEHLDFISLCDMQGNVVIRSQNTGVIGDNVLHINIVDYCLTNRISVASTEILNSRELSIEDSSLAERAEIEIKPTPRAKFQRTGIETSGMVICAAAPIFNKQNDLIGVLYCGKLINNNFEFVDRVKRTVFLEETYKKRDIGTATIFMKDLRVSTNVMDKHGARAIGTLVSNEVYDAVIEKGLFWIDRAFVVNDWYITSYMPIRNLREEIIGILYVGILETKYTDIRNQIIIIFMVVTLLGMVIVIGLSYLIANNITKPLSNIALAAKKIAQGNLPQQIEIKTDDEIADLGRAFTYMINSLQERDARLRESISKTVAEAERLATVGQLAAGVAHEINNPLTGILLYCDIILKELPKGTRAHENLNKISNEAKRCRNIVKGLLDYSRPKKPEIKEISLDSLVETTLSLIKQQVIFQNITVKTNIPATLPRIKIDPHQIQQVFLNLIINAAEAMEGNGTLTISAEIDSSGNMININFSDSGPGIDETTLKKIFDPFFSTKEATHGVGLGLAISLGIVLHHGGDIVVSSKMKKGTTFTVRLPLQ